MNIMVCMGVERTIVMVQGGVHVGSFMFFSMATTSLTFSTPTNLPHISVKDRHPTKILPPIVLKSLQNTLCPHFFTTNEAMLVNVPQLTITSTQATDRNEKQITDNFMDQHAIPAALRSEYVAACKKLERYENGQVDARRALDCSTCLQTSCWEPMGAAISAETQQILVTSHKHHSLVLDQIFYKANHTAGKQLTDDQIAHWENWNQRVHNIRATKISACTPEIKEILNTQRDVMWYNVHSRIGVG